MAAMIAHYCADAGTWAVQAFQLDRLATVGDLVATTINGGIDNKCYQRGLAELRFNGWVDAQGVTRMFVARLAETPNDWKPAHPIAKLKRCAAVVMAKA